MIERVSWLLRSLMHNRQQVILRLQRLFSRGRLEAYPRRDADRQILFALGTWQLRESRADTELQINSELKGWLAGFVHTVNVDHVSFRRALVDFGFINRTADGQRYWINGPRVMQVLEPDALDVDPGEILANAARDRKARKAQFLQRRGEGGR